MDIFVLFKSLSRVFLSIAIIVLCESHHMSCIAQALSKAHFPKPKRHFGSQLIPSVDEIISERKI